MAYAVFLVQINYWEIYFGIYPIVTGKRINQHLSVSDCESFLFGSENEEQSICWYCWYSIDAIHIGKGYRTRTGSLDLSLFCFLFSSTLNLTGVSFVESFQHTFTVPFNQFHVEDFFSKKILLNAFEFMTHFFSFLNLFLFFFFSFSDLWKNTMLADLGVLWNTICRTIVSHIKLVLR